MKKLIGIIIILAVLIFGGYFAMGWMTERTLKKDVAVINQSNGLLVTINEYDRGLFTSNAELTWRLHVPERVLKDQSGKAEVVPEQDYMVVMPLVIYHGPIIIAKHKVKFGLGYAETNLNLPQKFSEQFEQMFAAGSTKPMLEVNALVNYLNHTHLKLKLPAFQLIAKNQQGQFDWMGLESDTTFSSDLSAIHGGFKLKGLQWNKSNLQAKVGQVVSQYHLKQSDEGLYTGFAKLSFPTLEITSNDQTQFLLNNFDVGTSSKISDGLLSTDLTVSVEKILSHGKEFGPGHFKMAINNLDAHVFAEMNEQINKMQQDNAQVQKQSLLALIPQVPKLLNKGAEFKISDASMILPEGKLEAHMMLALPKGSVANPFELIQKVQGEGHLVVPAVVLKSLFAETAKYQLMQKSELAETISSQIQKDKDAQNSASAANEQSASSPKQGDESSASQQADASQAEAKTENTPVNLAEKSSQLAQEKLSSLVDAGLLVQDKDRYVIDLKLSNGQLLINDKPFNPDMLKF